MAKKKRKTPHKLCPQCGTSMHARTKLCPKCGAEQTKAKPSSQRRRRSTTRPSEVETPLAAAVRYVKAMGGLSRAKRILQQFEEIKGL